MTITATTLTPEKQQWIAHIFETYNEKKGFNNKHENFCFEYKNGDEVVGIVHGKFFGDWCNITDIAVSEKARGQGIGQQLMQHLESEARSRNLNGMHLTTITFQAPEFYEKLGFELYAKLDNYAGAERLLYKKEF